MARVARLDWIAKLGFLARAVVYIMLGYIALSTRSKADEGQSAVFDTLRDQPGGSTLLLLVAVGLFAYGLFRLATAFMDLDGEGSEAKGYAKRAGKLFSGIAHLLLGYTAVQFASRISQSGSSGGGSGSGEAARTVLELPLGSLLLGMIGVYFLITAGSQAMKAYKASFMHEISPEAPEFTRPIGRAGHAARAAVFLVVGLSFIRAGWFSDGGRAKDVGGALGSLRDNDTLYVAVALGLLLFGVFSLILARYRIVPEIDMAGAAKRAVGGAKPTWH